MASEERGYWHLIEERRSQDRTFLTCTGQPPPTIKASPAQTTTGAKAEKLRVRGTSMFRRRTTFPACCYITSSYARPLLRIFLSSLERGNIPTGACSWIICISGLGWVFEPAKLHSTFIILVSSDSSRTQK